MSNAFTWLFPQGEMCLPEDELLPRFRRSWWAGFRCHISPFPPRWLERRPNGSAMSPRERAGRDPRHEDVRLTLAALCFERRKTGQQDLLDRRRVCLAARGFHHLPEKPLRNGGLPSQVELNLIWVVEEHTIDKRFDRRLVGQLRKIARLDDLARRPALPDHLRQEHLPR